MLRCRCDSVWLCLCCLIFWTVFIWVVFPQDKTKEIKGYSQSVTVLWIFSQKMVVLSILNPNKLTVFNGMVFAAGKVLRQPASFDFWKNFHYRNSKGIWFFLFFSFLTFCGTNIWPKSIQAIQEQNYLSRKDHYWTTAVWCKFIANCGVT